jgi:stage V sporulation protein G
MPTGVAEPAGRGVIRKQWAVLRCRSHRRLNALTPQLLHPCADRREIVGGAPAGQPLAPQLVDSCADHGKIIGGTRSGHVSSGRLCRERGWLGGVNYPISGMSARKIASAVVARRIKYQRTGNICRCTTDRRYLRMGGVGSNDTGSTTPVSITVLSVTPMRAGNLFAIAAVEIDIDGVLIEIHGIRALHVPPAATRIELPTFRNAAGRSQAAVILPEEVRGPIGDAVLDQLVEIGLAVKRPALTASQLLDARAVSFGG